MKYHERMKRLVVLLALLPPILLIGFMVTLAPMVSSSLTAALSGAPATPPVPEQSAPVPIPPAMLRLYRAAAGTCPGLAWQVLAAVGTVESANGTSDAPGVHSGQNPAGAEGPMQFEPDTFAAYDRPVPPGGVRPPSPYDPVDAVYAAARMLCHDGGGSPSRLGAAIWDYNHSEVYVAKVIDQARAFGLGRQTGLAGTPDPGLVAVRYALAQVGTPYRWGGEEPGVGFDCSGLAQAAYQAAGVALPRVAQAQFDAGPRVPPTSPLEPGDLVFFGPSPGVVTHVGLVVDAEGVMVDAPHSGAAVRVEAFPVVVGLPWGDEFYMGATSPGGSE